MPHPEWVMRLGGGWESANFLMPQRHDPGSPSELEVLRALIDRCGRAPPPHADIENGLQNALARLMFLEGRLREQAQRTGGTVASEELGDYRDVVAEMRALREAVAELRERTNPGESAPLARGFVLRRKP